MFPLGQMMQMFSGKNPQQTMLNLMIQQYQNNPMFQRAQQMAAGKSPQEVQQIAQNICAQKGIDIDSAFSQFKNQFGL